MLFFVFVVQLVDLFSNLVRFLNLDVPGSQIFLVQALYLPKAIVYALPVALLFAVSFSLGTMYADNELISVFGSGVPLIRFVRPVIIIGLFLSVGLFFFNERVVTSSFARKNELTRTLLNVTRSFSNTKVTVRSSSGRFVYSADYYNDQRRQLTRVMILERTSNGAFAARIDADLAEWQNDHWTLVNGTEYRINESEKLSVRSFRREERPELTATPRSFQRVAGNIEELPLREARIWVRDLQSAGLPYRQALTDYYSRVSFALTPFIVVFLSSAIGGRFRKNILLMSLLASLVTAVVYYVTGMVLGIMAADGLVPPLLGAWSGVVLFTFLGVILFSRARS